MVCYLNGDLIRENLSAIHLHAMQWEPGIWLTFETAISIKTILIVLSFLNKYLTTNIMVKPKLMLTL